MKRIFLGLALTIFAAGTVTAQSTNRVDGYQRKDGTYVPAHERTNPNSTRDDNWSTRGNVNPNTRKVGTVDPYKPTTTAPRKPRY